MSPAKFREGEQTGRVINGPRPSPLKINKDSHSVQKSSTSVSVIVAPTNQQNLTANQQQRRPVIIYTHSPKIIHTEARDFMALVQKLTGLSRSRDESQTNDQTSSSEENNGLKPVSYDNNDSSSVIMDKKYGGDGVSDVKENSSSDSAVFKTRNPYFADIPLFTPNSTDFFFSPPSFFRYSHIVSPSPNMGKLI